MLGSINPFRRAMAAEAPAEVVTDVDLDGELADHIGDMAITATEETYRRRMGFHAHENWTCTSIKLDKEGGQFSKLHFVYTKDPIVRDSLERGVYIETWPFETCWHDGHSPDSHGIMQHWKEQWRVQALEISSVNPPCVDVVWKLHTRKLAERRRAKRNIVPSDEI